jgi:hypothetical protein
MERRFGADFSQVRVHTDPAAAESAKGLAAQAYTVGHDIVFASGRFAPHSASGKQLLAHELVHVLQQRHSAPGSGEGALAVGEHDTPAEAEAHRVADRVGAAAPVDHRQIQSRPRGVSRTPETWFRGAGVWVEISGHVDPGAPAQLGSFIHDLGPGTYLTDSQTAAASYAARSASENATLAQVGQLSVERSALGRVLDLTTDQRWLRLLKEPAVPGGAMTNGELMALSVGDKNYYYSLFRRFLSQNGLRLEEFDTIIGQEAIRGGRQMCIRTPGIAQRILRSLRPTGPLVDPDAAPRTPPRGTPGSGQGGAPGPGRSPEAGGRPGGGTGEAGMAPADPQMRVTSRSNVLSSVAKADGSVVSEIEVLLLEGLDDVNRAVVARGGPAVPARVLVRVTHTADGVLVGVEALGGAPQALAETLARQGMVNLPRVGAGAEGAVAGAVRGSSRLAKGLGWAGIVVFVVVTGYQLYTAPPADRPRVAVGAAGGFAAGALGTYVVCNLIFGIETVGLSLLACAIPAGAVTGYAGQRASEALYDEATMTAVDRAFRRLGAAPINTRRLFYAFVAGSAQGRGIPVTEDFIDGFLRVVPSDLTEQEFTALEGRLQALGPTVTLAEVLTGLRSAIEHLPGRGARAIAVPWIGITSPADRGVPLVPRIGALGGRIQLLPPPIAPGIFGVPDVSDQPHRRPAESIPLLQLDLD